jgi:SAM-dependent methyltransferase
VPLVPWPLAEGQVLDRCPSCGHVQRDLARFPAGSRESAWGGGDDMDRVRLALTYRRLLRLTGRPPRSVFEAGFGSGALLRRFADAGAVVAGADPGALGRAIDPVVAAAGALETRPVEEVTEGLGSYDLVYAVHVVEHVPAVWAFAAALRRLLAPGGLLVLITPAGDSDGLRVFGPSWWMLEDPTHVRFFSAVSGSLLLSRSALVDVRAERLVSDSLGVEASSLTRRLRGSSGGPGALAGLGTRAAVLASLPLVVPARALRTRWRPTLQLTARRPPA